ncbi:thiosulfate oxidation carrier protein SoxY [Polynucleobacter sp. MWH-Spelu-300-X4]|jgi:sulfur-oxidizing protein SoxY|uniref:thiosulfate oxidation carrier protein SoxY n=1 Tax=Polynucleobacter sp. MWH-Spelu-300-X4 TaxID=2689109 RepID=UPI001BFEB215|nr:thiosulfate oxidation carrier protein SoxY [Polynucleobacter sp. MWH-Spelu-300-X4]QWD79061.1 thiosulfate oxidation carrier protein SoxY [Polynucleobacter sp. MWH-Spelu-300-X4]
MNLKRREALRLTAIIGLMAATGLISEAQAADWNKAAFDGKSLDDVLKALGGSSADKSSAVTINAPDIAENGAVVPVGVTTTLPKTQQIAILVEKNPSALAAQFLMTADTEPFVASRVKMAQTSNVHALVKADGKWYVTTKEVKVTLGGCGG